MWCRESKMLAICCRGRSLSGPLGPKGEPHSGIDSCVGHASPVSELNATCKYLCKYQIK